MTKKPEIERAFEIIDKRTIDLAGASYIEQIYLDMEKSEGVQRIRKEETPDGVVYVACTKTIVSDLKKIENEREIDAEEYDRLSKFIQNGTVALKKRRVTLTGYGDTHVTVDIFALKHNEPLRLEIEFSSERDAKAFDFQRAFHRRFYLIREVTGKKSNFDIASK